MIGLVLSGGLVLQLMQLLGGLLMLLDPRIQTKRYGRIFLDSLPPYRITYDITEVEQFFQPLA